MVLTTASGNPYLSYTMICVRPNLFYYKAESNKLLSVSRGHVTLLQCTVVIFLVKIQFHHHAGIMILIQS